MNRPKSQKQLQAFIEMVYYYNIMWPRCAHILKPLTDISGTNKFKWTNNQEKSFKQTRALIAEDVLPNFSMSLWMPQIIN
jgi:hypothetical protein